MAKTKFPYPNLIMQRAGRSWHVLMFAKSMRRSFTLADLQMMNPTMFGKKNYGANHKAVSTLLKGGLLDRVDEGVYRINGQGLKYFDHVSQYFNTRRVRPESSAKQKKPRP